MYNVYINTTCYCGLRASQEVEPYLTKETQNGKKESSGP